MNEHTRDYVADTGIAAGATVGVTLAEGLSLGIEHLFVMAVLTVVATGTRRLIDVAEREARARGWLTSTERRG